jgi:hypothetical protein
MKGSIPNQEIEINPEDINAVRDLVSSIVPESLKQLAGILTDTVKGWRARNMINVLVKTKAHIQNSGLTQVELSGKFFLKTIEAAANEDNPSLQDKWATLLSNAYLGRITQDVKFVTILSELSDLEVSILDLMYSEWVASENRENLTFLTDKVSTKWKTATDDSKVIVDNFYRLNICRPPGATGMKFGDYNTGLQTNLVFEFTDLGIRFMRAVHGE